MFGDKYVIPKQLIKYLKDFFEPNESLREREREREKEKEKKKEKKWHMDCGSSSWKCSDPVNEQTCMLKYCHTGGCNITLHFLGTGHSLWLQLYRLL